MIRVKTIKEIPIETLDLWSRRSHDEASPMSRDVWLRMTKRMVCVYYDEAPIAIIGIRPTSMIGTGYEIWFLLCKGFKQYLRPFLRWARRIFPVLLKNCGRVLVRVEASHLAGIRLAQAFALRPTVFDESLDGKLYRRYEASWHSQ